MKLLALDLGTRMTGWAIFEDGNLAQVGRESFKNATDDAYFGAILSRFRTWSEGITKDIDVVAYEEIVPRNKHHMEQHFGMVGFLAEGLWKKQVMLLGINTGTMKKHTTGNGNASKEDTLHAVRRLYPEHTIEDHNVADAVGIGLVASSRLHQASVAS